MRQNRWLYRAQIAQLSGLLGRGGWGLGGLGGSGLGGGGGAGLFPVLGGALRRSPCTEGELGGGILLLHYPEGFLFACVVDGLVKRDIDFAEYEDLHVFEIS